MPDASQTPLRRVYFVRIEDVSGSIAHFVGATAAAAREDAEGVGYLVKRAQVVTEQDVRDAGCEFVDCAISDVAHGRCDTWMLRTPRPDTRSRS